MDQSPVDTVLKNWLAEVLAAVPPHNPRHTPECLSFPEVFQAVAGPGTLTSGRWDHARDCNWCRHAVRRAALMEAAQSAGVLRQSRSSTSGQSAGSELTEGRVLQNDDETMR